MDTTAQGILKMLNYKLMRETEQLESALSVRRRTFSAAHGVNVMYAATRREIIEEIIEAIQQKYHDETPR